MSGSVIVDLSAAGRRGSFRPAEALGAGIDGAQSGDIDRLFTPGNIKAMRSAGLRSLTYRLRTELGIEAWHWNPVGQWSDPARHQGYWTSSDRPGKPIELSWGYRLPRRGDTVDNANDVDYSRLTDGDDATFWKSNPYLDPHYTRDGQPHPQWLVLRLDAPTALDTAEIRWGEPYATRYEVQYWTAHDQYDPKGRWAAFPHGIIEQGRGGSEALKLADRPITAQFVRVLLRRSSGTAPAGAIDPRDRMGFTVREVAFGQIGADGKLHDVVHHAPSHDRQTFTHVSSTDPWHRAIDRDPDLEQAGLDRVFRSRLGNGLPVLVPVGVLFDTPDNASAELRYLRRRGYPVKQVELGEEPDGQYGDADDYGALYLAFVDRLKRENPGIIFGGPSLQSAFTDSWMNPDSDRSWNGQFVRYLQTRHRLADLGFFSFEHYPFDDICGDISTKLVEQNHLMDRLFERLAQDGVSRRIPWLISEYGFSAYSGRAMAEMPSALLMANIVGQFLTAGGHSAYMFGYGPNVPINQHQPCAGYGNMMLFTADPQGQAALPTPSYHTARLLSAAWLMPGRRRHDLLAAETRSAAGELVKTYAVRRPDGRLGILILNRSPTQGVTLNLLAKDSHGRVTPLHGSADIHQYGPAQYEWHDDGEHSRPSRDEPPTRSRTNTPAIVVTVPPESLTVVVDSPFRQSQGRTRR